jgi:hypothetical protein
MSLSTYEELAEEAKAELLTIIAEVRKEVIDPITDFGNPERLLGTLLKDDPNYKPLIKKGKLPYEVWRGNAAILQWLGQKYGPGNTALERFIGKWEVDNLYELEQGVK